MIFNTKLGVVIMEANVEKSDLKKYKKDYSEESFMDKALNYGKTIGVELVYKAAQLFYVLQKPEVPVKVKSVIIGALGYLISPIDAIPDIIPVVGYTDDAAAIGIALVVAATYIDDEVNEKAKKFVRKIFGYEAAESL